MARAHVDVLFLAEFRQHVGNSFRVVGTRVVTCGCNLDGPDKDCDIGTALYAVAHQVPWDERKAATKREMGIK